MRKHLIVTVAIVVFLVCTSRGSCQHWSVGGNVGMSLLGGSPGFHLTPMAELLFDQSMGVGTEFSMNSQYGEPLIWHSYFKYYFGIRGSHWKPYASFGPVMAMDVPNGPCFGFLFGGGANIPIGNKLYLAPDLLFGPVFGYGGGQYPYILSGYYWGIQTFGLTSFQIPSITVLAFSVRGGIRYEI